MQGIDLSGIEGLDKALAGLLKEFPTARRELHRELAALAKKEADAAVVSSGLDDAHGKVRGWQRAHVGSGGGYAAVRAAGSKEGGGTGPHSAGAITNYLENGHKIGKTGRRVGGYHFYQTARAGVEAKAARLAERFAEKLAERLEGEK